MAGHWRQETSNNFDYIFCSEGSNTSGVRQYVNLFDILLINVFVRTVNLSIDIHVQILR